MYPTMHTSADARNQHELLAEIGRLHQQVFELNQLHCKMRETADWLEQQEVVFTPELCWTPGNGTLQDRIHEIVAAKELVEREQRKK